MPVRIELLARSAAMELLDISRFLEKIERFPEIDRHAALTTYANELEQRQIYGLASHAYVALGLNEKADEMSRKGTELAEKRMLSGKGNISYT